MRSSKLGCAVLTLLGVVVLGQADTATTGDLPWQRYEWRASTFTPSTQHQAALAVYPNGDLLTVWSSRRQQNGRAGVYAQRFDTDGVARGVELPVGLYTKAHQTNPAVAIDAQGNAWIVWESFGQDGQAGTIVARRFDQTLAGGSEICVNQEWRGHQASPVIAVSPAGGVAIVWTSAVPGRPIGLRARLLQPDGQPLGDEFAIGTDAARVESVPSIAFGPDGNFMIAFGVFDEQGWPAGIRTQRFDAAGRRLGAELDVCGASKASQVEPVIAATPTGYVVAWHDSESDGSDYGVLARRFDAAGRPLDTALVVNTTRVGLQNAAALAVDRDGRFVVAWNSDDEDKTGVFARRFAADGAPAGDEFRLCTATAGPQALRAAAGTTRLVFAPQGDLACVWSGDAGLGDKSSVNLTLLTPRAIALAGRVQGITADMPPARAALAAADGPKPHEPPTFDPKLIDRDAERIVSRDGRFGFTAVTHTGWTPPDPHMAVGPDHIVVMTNGEISFYEKSGVRTFQDEIEDSYGFWGALGTTEFVFDPEVLYDELSGRFFAMAVEGYAPGDRSYVLVAVSDDSNPNGTWYKYRFDTTALAGDLFDSPNMGVDAQAVYITGDGFGITANYPVYIFDKASLLAGLPPVYQYATTLATSTQSAGIPPVAYDNPPAFYMIEHQEGSNRTHVRLIALSSALSAPTFSTYQLTVPTYSAPANPPQKGTTLRPELFDARFWSVAYRNGSLWATHHVNSTRVRARWYEIAMNGWPASGQNPQLVQSGELDLGSDVYTYFTAINVNKAGDAVITCARSSPTSYIDMISAYRVAEDPPGTFRTADTERMSTNPDTSERWGDYGGVGPDPLAPYAIWVHHEYTTSNSWKTWVARVDLPKRLGDLNCDGLVSFGDINPFVTALLDAAEYAAAFPNCDRNLADLNSDGVVNFGDINPFVDLLTN